MIDMIQISDKNKFAPSLGSNAVFGHLALSNFSQV